MLVDTMDPPAAEGTEAGRGLPALEPVHVAPEGEVDALVRAARAGIAMLSLQLRSAQQDAELAESRAQEHDFVGARELIDASLTHWVESRRLQMAQELEQAREDAVNLVSAAHAEAADVVAQASEESLAVLLAGMRTRPDGGAPGLHVVPEQLVAPVVLPAPRDHPSVPVVLPPSPAPEPQVDLVPEPVPDSAPAPEPVPQGEVVREADTTSAPAVVVTPAAPPSTDGEPASTSPPSRLNQLLYLDVLLPLLAVLVVLVVLLAWVG